MLRSVRSLALVLATLSPLAASQANAADTYEIDAAHAAAVFQVNHLGISTTHGRFNEISGSFVVDEANVGKSSVQLEIKTKSVDTANAKRDEHLRGPDFFDVKQYSKITLVSKSVSKNADGSYQVTGDVTMHGVTKTVSVAFKKVGEGKDPWGGYRAGFDATFSLKRSDFGMKYMLEGIGDDVKINVAIEGVRK